MNHLGIFVFTCYSVSRFTGFCSVITACGGRPLSRYVDPAKCIIRAKRGKTGAGLVYPPTGRIRSPCLARMWTKRTEKSTRIPLRQPPTLYDCKYVLFGTCVHTGCHKSKRSQRKQFFFVGNTLLRLSIRFQIFDHFFDVSSQIFNLNVLTLLANTNSYYIFIVSI